MTARKELEEKGLKTAIVNMIIMLKDIKKNLINLIEGEMENIKYSHFSFKDKKCYI